MLLCPISFSLSSVAIAFVLGFPKPPAKLRTLTQPLPKGEEAGGTDMPAGGADSSSSRPASVIETVCSTVALMPAGNAARITSPQGVA